MPNISDLEKDEMIMVPIESTEFQLCFQQIGKDKNTFKLRVLFSNSYILTSTADILLDCLISFWQSYKLRPKTLVRRFVPLQGFF